jgi:peptidoglycan/LPS O-acetylase OafA/YrhL
MQTDSRASTILGVQYLRAVGALMVAYWHLRIQIPAYTEYLTPDWAVDTDRLRAASISFSSSAVSSSW